jgi:hypothetical protein
MSLYQAARDGNQEARNANWEASMENLLTAIKTGKGRLVEELSMSFTKELNQLTNVNTDDEAIACNLMCLNVARFNKALDKENFDQADMISRAGVELLRAAINQRMPSLTKDISVSWLKMLDMERTEERTRSQQEMLDRLLKARMNDSMVAISQRNNRDGRHLFIVGVRLLLTAIEGKKTKTTRTISKYCVVAWQDAIDNRGEREVKSLIDIFNTGLHKVGLLLKAIMELLLAAIREGKVRQIGVLAGYLAQSWVDGMKKNQDAAMEFLKAVRVHFDEESDAEEKRNISVAAQGLLKVGKQLDKIVVQLIKKSGEWELLLQLPLNSDGLRLLSLGK